MIFFSFCCSDPNSVNHLYPIEFNNVLRVFNTLCYFAVLIVFTRSVSETAYQATTSEIPRHVQITHNLTWIILAVFVSLNWFSQVFDRQFTVFMGHLLFSVMWVVMSIPLFWNLTKIIHILSSHEVSRFFFVISGFSVHVLTLFSRGLHSEECRSRWRFEGVATDIATDVPTVHRHVTTYCQSVVMSTPLSCHDCHHHFHVTTVMSPLNITT